MTDTLTLWTVQDQDFWRRCEARGAIRGDGRHIDRHMRPAYRWLKEQMALRTSGYTGRYPVWAWQTPKPDLRRTYLARGGDECVLVEFEAPADKVLLSDFDTWHYVLNGWYIPTDFTDDDAHPLGWPRSYIDKYGFSFSSEEEARVCRESWERIFDLELASRCPEYFGEGELYVQATVEQVPLEWVRKVRPFVARRSYWEKP